MDDHPYHLRQKQSHHSPHRPRTHVAHRRPTPALPTSNEMEPQRRNDPPPQHPNLAARIRHPNLHARPHLPRKRNRQTSHPRLRQPSPTMPVHVPQPTKHPPLRPTNPTPSLHARTAHRPNAPWSRIMDLPNGLRLILFLLQRKFRPGKTIGHDFPKPLPGTSGKSPRRQYPLVHIHFFQTYLARLGSLDKDEVAA